MNSLFDRLSFAPFHDQALRTLLAAALVQFYGFTLVLVRLSGLMIVGPHFRPTHCSRQSPRDAGPHAGFRDHADAVQTTAGSCLTSWMRTMTAV